MYIEQININDQGINLADPKFMSMIESIKERLDSEFYIEGVDGGVGVYDWADAVLGNINEATHATWEYILKNETAETMDPIFQDILEEIYRVSQVTRNINVATTSIILHTQRVLKSVFGERALRGSNPLSCALLEIVDFQIDWGAIATVMLFACVSVCLTTMGAVLL